MFAVARPLAACACGVVLLTSGTIASTPSASAAADDLRGTHAAVQLSASPSPLAFYPQVALKTFQNAVALTEAYFADPFPITRAILANQIAALSDAVAAFAIGDGDAAFSALGSFIAQPLKIFEGANIYLNKTYNQPFQDLFFPIVTAAPFVNLVAAAGVALNDVIDAVVTIDVVGLVNAVVNIPARILDGFLNGGYWEHSPGLITPYDPEETTLPGPLAAFTDFIQGTADSIPPWSSTTPTVNRQPVTEEAEESSVALDGVPTMAPEAGEAANEQLDPDDFQPASIELADSDIPDEAENDSARQPTEPEGEDDVATDDDHAAPVSGQSGPAQSEMSEPTTEGSVGGSDG